MAKNLIASEKQIEREEIDWKIWSEKKRMVGGINVRLIHVIWMRASNACHGIINSRLKNEYEREFFK